jgi:hypothetical protein
MPYTISSKLLTLRNLRIPSLNKLTTKSTIKTFSMSRKKNIGKNKFNNFKDLSKSLKIRSKHNCSTIKSKRMIRKNSILGIF